MENIISIEGSDRTVLTGEEARGGDVIFTSGKGFPRDKEVSMAGAIRFRIGSDTVDTLVLDKDGMMYKGQRIEDAGEAHKAFVETVIAMILPDSVRKAA